MSFFAFQDIITSVTGILLLVTLIMTLYLNPPAAGTAGEADPRVTALKAQISSIQASNVSLINDISRARNAHPLSRLHEEIRDLEEALKQMRSQDVETVEALADAYDGLRRTNAMLQAESKQLQIKLEEAKLNLDEQKSKSNVVFVIKGAQQSRKTPVLTTVSGQAVTLERLGDPTGARALPAANLVAAFASELTGLAPRQVYILFIVRPSGIALFEALKAAAIGAGFEVGFEPVPEDLKFNFGPGGAP